MIGETVNLVPARTPEDYHCACKYCQESIGEILRSDGTFYSRLERREYYDPIERGAGGHIAKTPLHIARWAIQAYTVPGEWVLDPTIGSGTTAVEAITQGRNAAGMELEYGEILVANVKKALQGRKDLRAEIASGDARNIGSFLDQLGIKFSLVVSNPPYSGDVSMPSPKGNLRGKEHRHLETRFDYDRELPNIAFLKEGPEYWETMEGIYQSCIDHMVPGGAFVVGIKDMMRNKEPFMLHQGFCDLLARLGLEFKGTAFLRHHPGTLFLNSYPKMYGVRPPLYQTISVFKKSHG